MNNVSEFRPKGNSNDVSLDEPNAGAMTAEADRPNGGSCWRPLHGDCERDAGHVDNRFWGWFDVFNGIARLWSPTRPDDEWLAHYLLDFYRTSGFGSCDSTLVCLGSWRPSIEFGSGWEAQVTEGPVGRSAARD
jgi:hypothetical protein